MTKENHFTKEDPITEFPHFPGYNQKKDPKNFLPWSWVENNVSKSVNYWISTISKSKPYLTPVWCVWVNNISKYRIITKSNATISVGASNRKTRIEKGAIKTKVMLIVLLPIYYS